MDDLLGTVKRAKWIRRDTDRAREILTTLGRFDLAATLVPPECQAEAALYCLFFRELEELLDSLYLAESLQPGPAPAGGNRPFPPPAGSRRGEGDK